MKDPRILISGDYWHHEFQSIVANFPVPVTLTPIDRMESLLDQSFDLIVLAQTRPDQIPAEVVEQIQASQPATPVVALLGSWCEGGMRSDVPWPGVRRIYWHQWAGQFEQFSQQLAEDGLAIWNQPGTATDADDAMLSASTFSPNSKMLVAVSAADQTQFQYLRDAIDSFGWKSCWAERTTFDPDTIRLVSAICVDANSVTDDLVSRIDWLQNKLAGKPMSVVLNFPRSQDVESASLHGIQDTVSKPFTLADLKLAIESSMKRFQKIKSNKPGIPAPHAFKKAPRTV